MIILAIETSCDDTGIALVKKDKKGITVLSRVLSSQDEIHKKWGGVYPFEAKREHQKNLLPSLEKVLEKADFLKPGSTPAPEELSRILLREEILLKEFSSFLGKNKITKKIDSVAVTAGPGLEPCLYVGVNFAKALATTLNIPLIPINHIKAHILSFLFEKEDILFPAVALVASGGHTELVLMKSLHSYKLLGKTRDDAAGECFDKTARVLGLGYPGGPAIAKQALQWKSKITNSKFQTLKLPRPMMYSKDYDFSFSGLKTAVLYDFLSRKKKTQKDKTYIVAMAKEIEEAVTDVLTSKLKRALREHNAKTAILGGGVTANKTLQKKVNEITSSLPEVEIIFPPPSMSTDNAEMIAAAATVEKKRKNYATIKPNANLTVY